MTETLKELKYNNTSCYVEAANKDGKGNVIDTTYVRNDMFDDWDYEVVVWSTVNGSNLETTTLNVNTGAEKTYTSALPSGGGSSYILPKTMCGAITLASSKSFLTVPTVDTSTGVATTLYYQWKYDKISSSASYYSTNYAKTNSSWTYVTSLTGSSYASRTVMIKFKASANFGGVALSTSSSSFSETNYSGNKGIATTYANCWGTLTVEIPPNTTYYLWTQMTTYVFVNYLNLTSTSTAIDIAVSNMANSGGSK